MRAIAFAIMFAAATNIINADFAVLSGGAQSVSVFVATGSFIGFMICIIGGY